MSTNSKHKEFFLNNFRFFDSIDISYNEFEIYVYLLEKGASTIIEISKEVKIPRTTVYERVKKLINKSFVTKINFRNTNRFIAEQPVGLEKIIDKKEEDLKLKFISLNEVKNELPIFIAKLLSNTDLKKRNENTVIKHYSGLRSVENLYDEILSTSILYCHANATWVKDYMPYITERFSEKLANKSITIFDIVIDLPKNKYVHETLSSHKGNYSYKKIGYRIEFDGIDYSIYSNKIAVIYMKKAPEAIVIEDNLIFAHAKATFNLLWNNLPNEF